MKAWAPPIKALIEDKTAERAFGAIYRNTKGRPILVELSATFEKDAALDDCYVIAYHGPTTPPAQGQAVVGYFGLAGSSPERVAHQIVFMVPNGWYYRVIKMTSGASNVTVFVWTEIVL